MPTPLGRWSTLPSVKIQFPTHQLQVSGHLTSPWTPVLAVQKPCSSCTLTWIFVLDLDSIWHNSRFFPFCQLLSLILSLDDQKHVYTNSHFTHKLCLNVHLSFSKESFLLVHLFLSLWKRVVCIYIYTHTYIHKSLTTQICWEEAFLNLATAALHSLPQAFHIASLHRLALPGWVPNLAPAPPVSTP